MCQSGAVSPQIATTSHAEKLGHAEKLIGAGDLQGALAELDALAAEHPEPAGLEYLRGFAYYQESDLGDAETALARAVSQDAGDGRSRQLLGLTLYRRGRPAEAIRALEAGRAAGGSGAALANGDDGYLLALCYIDAQRYDDARRSIAAEYGFPAESAAAYLATARILVRKESMEAAEAAARKSLELNPRFPLAHELLGEIDLAKSDISAAIQEFQSERALNPLHAAVYERLGDAYFRNGDYELARQSLDRALLLDQSSTGPYILLGKVLMKQQNSLMALGYLQRAARMDPANYATHYLLGQAYHATGRTEEAAREFQLSERMRFGEGSSPGVAR